MKFTMNCVTMLIAIVALSGCDALRGPAHNKAQFIRTHKCTIKMIVPPSKEYDAVWGTMDDVPGHKFYACEGLQANDTLLIWDNEEQP